VNIIEILRLFCESTRIFGVELVVYEVWDSFGIMYEIDEYYVECSAIDQVPTALFVLAV